MCACACVCVCVPVHVCVCVLPVRMLICKSKQAKRGVDEENALGYYSRSLFLALTIIIICSPFNYIRLTE